MQGQQARVFFDAVGTLIYPDPPVYSVYHRIAQRYGSRLSEHDIAVLFKQAYQRHFAGQSIENLRSTEALERQRWQLLIDQVFDDLPGPQTALFSELWTHFSAHDHWQVYADIYPILDSLRNAGVYLGIATNFDARIIPICKQLFPDIQAERIFYSSRLGYAKPHTQFYKRIKSNFSDAGAVFIMVGDDIENDIHAARNAGWDAIHRDHLTRLLDTLSLS